MGNANVQLGLLDQPEGERRRDVAVAQVERGADAAWLEAAYSAVTMVAERQQTLTTDDVWAWLGRTPDSVMPVEPRAMGAVMKRAQRAGYIVSTGEYVQTKRPQAHCSPVRVWASRVCHG